MVVLQVSNADKFVAERGRKLVISIEPMQRSIAVDLEAYDVEVV